MPASEQRNRRAVLRGVVVAVLATLVVVVGAGDAGQSQQGSSSAIERIAEVSPQIADRLMPFRSLLSPVTSVTNPLPSDPVSALAGATQQLSAALGFRQDPAPAIRAAGLPPDVAGRLAVLVNDMTVCHRLTARYTPELFRKLPELFRDRTGLKPDDFPEILPCAIRMWTSVGELESTVKAALGPAGRSAGCRPIEADAIDVWPVLRFEPGCVDNAYRNDYLLTVDVGGDDTYANNVGSNVVDINFSPEGSAVSGRRGVGPARGCQRGLNGLGRDECYLSAGVLLDVQGSDSFGLLENPDHDALCTSDPVVRRMVTGGAAFLGVGILRDAATSNDRYFGKTISLGAGHVFGIGLLSDAGGDDAYLAVRNSEGYGLIAGLGLLHDEGGNDTYDYYMPAPIDESAPNQSDGAGGVRDNEGDGSCDRIPRFTGGAANLSSAGVLLDDGGDDRYHAAFSAAYSTNPVIPGMLVTGGSLGYAANNGVAVLVDGGGRDTYAVDEAPFGVPVRSDRRVIRPGGAATDAFGTGLFIDE